MIIKYIKLLYHHIFMKNMTDKEIYTDYIIKNSPLQTMIDKVIIYK